MSGCHDTNVKECHCKCHKVFGSDCICNCRYFNVNETLENRINICEQNYPSLWKRIEKLEKKLNSFDEIYKACNRALDILRFTDQVSKQPFKCPVCEGTGKDKDKLVAEPYDQSIKVLVNPHCKSCEGKGIVWV